MKNQQQYTRQNKIKQRNKKQKQPKNKKPKQGKKTIKTPAQKTEIKPSLIFQHETNVYVGYSSDKRS